jgi:hypothetical protein
MEVFNVKQIFLFMTGSSLPTAPVSRDSRVTGLLSLKENSE